MQFALFRSDLAIRIILIRITPGDLLQLFRCYRQEGVHHNRIEMAAAETFDLSGRLLRSTGY